MVFLQANHPAENHCYHGEIRQWRTILLYGEVLMISNHFRAWMKSLFQLFADFVDCWDEGSIVFGPEVVAETLLFEEIMET